MSNIAIVGHGNVGSHLAKRLSQDHQVSIFSRSSTDQDHLELRDLVPKDFDFVFLSLPDRVIHPFSERLPMADTIILHTSGSRPLSDLSKHGKRGVLYPLQTFSRNKPIDFKPIKLLVEGNGDTQSEVLKLALSMSKHVEVKNSKDRLKIHLAAVFACNFTNHMYQIAEKHLAKVGMTFPDLQPLVEETLEKALQLAPSNAQTGPAVRRDQVTIEKHLDMLEGDEKLIYQLITQSIQTFQ